jgi:hypothetical protein
MHRCSFNRHIQRWKNVIAESVIMYIVKYISKLVDAVWPEAKLLAPSPIFFSFEFDWLINESTG